MEPTDLKIDVSAVNKVFVYGTLKRGFTNHEIFLKDCRLCAECAIPGVMIPLSGFPGLSNHARERRKVDRYAFARSGLRLLVTLPSPPRLALLRAQERSRGEHH